MDTAAELAQVRKWGIELVVSGTDGPACDPHQRHRGSAARHADAPLLHGRPAGRPSARHAAVGVRGHVVQERPVSSEAMPRNDTDVDAAGVHGTSRCCNVEDRKVTPRSSGCPRSGLARKRHGLPVRALTHSRRPSRRSAPGPVPCLRLCLRLGLACAGSGHRSSTTPYEMVVVLRNEGMHALLEEARSNGLNACSLGEVILVVRCRGPPAVCPSARRTAGADSVVLPRDLRFTS